MNWDFIVALVIAVPVILFPAVCAWYINAGGIYRALKGSVNPEKNRGETDTEIS